MFLFYDIKVFPNMWITIVKDGKKVHRIINDKNALDRVLSSSKILVGYNNYKYADVLLWAILYDKNVYATSQALQSGGHEEFRFVKLPFITLDASQENGSRLITLQEIQANQGKQIEEMDIDFHRPLLDEKLKDVSNFMYGQVKQIEEIFHLRKDYFETKFDIVNTFKLNAAALKKTQTGLVAEVLKAKKYECKDRLDFRYDERIPLNEIPDQIVRFYESIRDRWKSGGDAELLEKESFTIDIAGVEHQFGFGGLHGARKNYIANGDFMQIDVRSFYPSLMINNDFISRASASPELFKQLYDERFRLKAAGDPKENLYKLLLNKAFGASKAKYNKLFDPHQANNIAINGQLILTHLILLLEPVAELIQSNTDGVIIKYERDMKGIILDLVERFSERYELEFSIDEIERVAQRDVNNYAIRYRNGKVKAVGFMSKHTGGTWARNHLNIIDVASVNYYLNGIDPARTVIEEYKRDNLALFQMVVEKGKFDGVVYESKSGELCQLPDVVRIFAGKTDEFGLIYKKAGARITKIPDSPKQSIVYNGSLNEFDKTELNLRFYIDLITGKLFDEKLV